MMKLCEQPAQSAVGPSIDGRRTDSHDEHAVAHADDLVTVSSRLKADGDLRSGHREITARARIA